MSPIGRQRNDRYQVWRCSQLGQLGAKTDVDSGSANTTNCIFDRNSATDGDAISVRRDMTSFRCLDEILRSIFLRIILVWERTQL